MPNYSLTSAKAREIGLLGGRPRGVLNKSTIEKIKTKKAMEAAIAKKAGFIVDNLLQGSRNLDTSASKELLERAFGKVPQGVQMQVATFSLKELAEYREKLKNPPLQDVPEDVKKDDPNIVST